MTFQELSQADLPNLSSGRQRPPRIADHELLRRIGQGSYGEVWLARSLTGSFRAIKIIARGAESSRGFDRELAGLRKFEPISRAAAGLVHILQVGEDPGGEFFYYIMELADDGNREEPWSATHQKALRGELDVPNYIPRTLGLEKRRRGRLPANDCLHVALALAEGLANVHERGLVHRDLKPSNIIFVEGQPKLADIGLVAEMSEANSYVGTEGYIAPEGPNSPQGDIYSLGKVLYEILTGKDRQEFPDPVTKVDSAEQHLFRELNAVILKACHPDKSSRYQSAGEMRSELQLLLGGRSVMRKHAADRRTRMLAWAGAGAAILCLAVLVFNSLLESRVRAIQGTSSLIRPTLREKIAERDPRAPDETIDLSAFYNAPLIESWYPGPGENTLESLPRGMQNLGGVKFDVRGLVQLTGGEISSSSQSINVYPRHVRGVPIDKWLKRLHFLHGTVGEVSEGRKIGSYLVEYISGRTVELPLRYGEEVRSFWQPAQSDGFVSKASPAWTGTNPATHERNLALRLYHFTWENPLPNEQVVHVHLRSEMSSSAPFLVALTVDEHQPAPGEVQALPDLASALRAAAGTFPELHPAPIPSGELQTFSLNAGSIKLGDEYFSAFRFKTPPTPGDLVWAFAEGTNSRVRQWQIMPMQGRMKVGFEDWYHGGGHSENSTDDWATLRLQHLPAKKLSPAAEYLIWFSFGHNAPGEMQSLLRFAGVGELDPNQPEQLARTLGLEKQPATADLKFHRHFCLGAMQ